MSQLKLTAIAFEAHTPGVFIGRLKEIGGVFAQNDSIAAVLAHLDSSAWHMLHSYKQAEAQALLTAQYPDGDGWLSGIVITHDIEASQAERTKMSAPARPIPDTFQLLSDERLAAIVARDTISRGRGHALEAQADRADLLIHIVGQQALFNTRDKELCQAHEEFKQQVATELAGLLQYKTFNDDVDDYANGYNEATEEGNDRVYSLATRLGIDLKASS